MPSRVVDVIVFEQDGTWVATSPQVPALVGGRERVDELTAEVPGMLAFAGVDIADTELRWHQERLYEFADGSDLVVRIASDSHYAERLRTANRLEAALADGLQREDMLDAPRTPTGEVLYVCGVPSDRLRWVAEQLHQDGDGAAVAVCVAEEMIWVVHIGTSPAADEWAQPLSHFGFSLDTTLSEIMRTQVISNRPRRLALTA